MAFYQDLSPYYDELFAVDDTELRFVAGILGHRSRILDIGCGTGNKTVLLSTPDNAITAVDQDSAMLERARADNARPNIRYVRADMADLESALQGLRFDGIVCLGNTLVHLAAPEAIQALLESAARLLERGGVCILQILNYDRILDRNIRELPVLETPRARFVRRYVHREGRLHFVTDLDIRETGRTVHNDIVLYPLRRAELAAMLDRAGFGKVAYFGSYQGTALDDDSFVCIAVCAAS